ncbi:MAG: hypothetical protein ABWY33_04180 [Cellulomonas sp.]
MTRTRTLLRDANPVREARGAPLSPRARGELYALVPSTARGWSGGTPGRRPRGVGVGVALVGAVALVVVVAVLLPMLRGAPGSSSTADYPYYGTTAELEGTADLIVRGTVTSIAGDGSQGYPRNVATVDVTASAKGDVVAGTTLEIAYTSGSEDPLGGLAVGGEYVLLLDDLSELDGGFPPTPVNADQGVYEVVGGHAQADPGNPVPLDPATLQALGLS